GGGNCRSAGLDDLMEMGVGVAFDPLRAVGGGKIVLVLLEGGKQLSLPMLQMLEPRLAPGAVVVADDLNIAREAVGPYLEHVRARGGGYVSVELPLGDSIEVSLRA